MLMELIASKGRVLDISYINLENGGLLPSWIQILLLAALNILLNNKPDYLRSVRFLYNSLKFPAAEQNHVWNITWQYTLVGKN